MEEITRNDLNFFQNEILKDMKSMEKKLNEKITIISTNFQNTSLLMEQKYENIKVKLGSIYKIYGNFEYNLTLTRFFIYLAMLVILVLLKIKRIIFGGFSNYALLLMSNIFSILFTIINAAFFILSLILTIFSLLCILTDHDSRKNNYYRETFFDYFFLKLIFVIDLIINILITVDIILILKNSFTLFEKISGIKNDYIKINKVSEDKSDKDDEKNYIYIGLDNYQYVFSEYTIYGFPRYLFYVLHKIFKTNENKDDESFDINSKNNLKVKELMDETY